MNRGGAEFAEVARGFQFVAPLQKLGFNFRRRAIGGAAAPGGTRIKVHAVEPFLRVGALEPILHRGERNAEIFRGLT